MSTVFGNLSKKHNRSPIYSEETVKLMARHINDSENPHSVTPGKIGSYTKGEVDGYVSGLSEQITSNYDDLSGEITNLRTTTQQSFDTVGEIVSGKADSDKVYSKEQVDELIAAGGGGVKDAYTKEEVDVILQNYAKKQQSFDGIIYLDFNDGVLDTYALDNANVPGIYRVIVNDDNDILAETYRNQYILLVGNTIAGEELVFTQTRMSDGGLFETRSRSIFDEGWSEWHNKMLGDIDSALDELHGYATSLMGGEA